jgi:hypothetical protein
MCTVWRHLSKRVAHEFLLAQQIAATPAIWMFLLVGRFWGNLEEGTRTCRSANQFSNSTSNKFGCWASEEHVQDSLFFIAELAFRIPNPSSSSHIIFRSHGIVPARNAYLRFCRHENLLKSSKQCARIHELAHLFVLTFRFGRDVSSSRKLASAN